MNRIFFEFPQISFKKIQNFRLEVVVNIFLRAIGSNHKKNDPWRSIMVQADRVGTDLFWRICSIGHPDSDFRFAEMNFKSSSKTSDFGVWIRKIVAQNGTKGSKDRQARVPIGPNSS